MNVRFNIKLMLCALLVALAVPAMAGTFERVSVSSEGTQGDKQSLWPAISANTRFVAFHSEATNLVPGDTNGADDIFVHDRVTGTTEMVSVSSGGAQGDDHSGWPAISADGRFVAFMSNSTNLVPNDTNGASDIFVHDRATGTTVRASVSSEGAEGDGISYWRPVMSTDGRFVAFVSTSTNLVPNDTNGAHDVFVRDLVAGTTERVNVRNDGGQSNFYSWAPAISADGRYVSFYSIAWDLVPGDTNGAHDVFVHDRETGTTERVSVSSDGVEGDDYSWRSSLSPDGRFVGFHSAASTLVPDDTNGVEDVFVHDRETGTTERVSVSSNGTEGNGFSRMAALSVDGRFVVFHSSASTLVPDDTNNFIDMFVRDRWAGTTERLTVNSFGEEGNGNNWMASLSPDGRFVAFMSSARNLVSGDTNGVVDILVSDRGAVVPQSPEEAAAAIEGLVATGSVDARIARSLLAKLEAALKAKTPGAALGPLGAFINQVNAQAGKKIDPETAAELIEMAEVLIALQ